jgi:hypothetical protein
MRSVPGVRQPQKKMGFRGFPLLFSPVLSGFFVLFFLVFPHVFHTLTFSVFHRFPWFFHVFPTFSSVFHVFRGFPQFGVCTAHPILGEMHDMHQYASLVGSLLHPAIVCRPDLAFVSSFLGRYMHAPTEQHFLMAKRVLRYVRGTADLGLSYCRANRAFSMFAYVDASNAACPDTRRGITGYLTYINGNLVHWRSQRQKCVATTSTSAAEYIAMSECCKEVIIFRRALVEMRLLPPDYAVTIYEDNSAAAMAASGNAGGKVTRHVDTRYHYVTEKVAEARIDHN